MKRLKLVVPVFMLLAVSTMASPALAGGTAPPPSPVPEPSSIMVFAGLAAVGFVGWLWRGRRRRS
jgi:LPXTG-motif cell wall-anchored protein